METIGSKVQEGVETIVWTSFTRNATHRQIAVLPAQRQQREGHWRTLEIYKIQLRPLQSILQPPKHPTAIDGMDRQP